MANAADILTNNLDVWTSAIERRSAVGRGRSKKFSLYGIEKLRSLIFDLAALGKLIDAPAIATTKLGKHVELIMGQAPPGDKCNKSGIGTVFVKTGEFGPLYPETVEWTTLPLKMAKHGDVLICVVGATIGKLNLAIDCAIGRSVAAIRPNNKIDTKFLYYSLMPYTIRLRADSRGSAQGVIGKDDLNAIAVRVPPLPEQHRIVAKVDELMALCDRLEAQTYDAIEAHELLVGNLLATLTRSQNAKELAENWARIETHFDMLFTTEASIDQLKQTILQLAVMGKLVPQDPNDEPASELMKRVAQQKKKWSQVNKIRGSKLDDRPEPRQPPFTLPSNWDWSSPDDFSMKITDGEHFRPETQSDGVFFLSAKDVREDGVSLADPLFISEETAAKARSRCDPEFGDLLIVSRGATCGRICKVNISDVFCLLGSVILIKPSPLLDNSYLELALKSPLIHSALISASGATAQGAIYLRDLKKICVPIPPVAEQRRIFSVANHLLVICEELKRAFSSAQTAQISFADAVATQAVA